MNLCDMGSFLGNTFYSLGEFFTWDKECTEKQYIV